MKRNLIAHDMVGGLSLDCGSCGKRLGELKFPLRKTEKPYEPIAIAVCEVCNMEYTVYYDLDWELSTMGMVHK